MAMTDTIDLTEQVPEWSLGDRLAKARRSAGIKQQSKMADMVGAETGETYSPAAISAWERDQHQPGNLLAVVAAWSKITGVPQDWLLGLRTGSR